PSTVMNTMAGTTSIALGLKGPMLTLNQSGVAGEVAIMRAPMLWHAGRAPGGIAGGWDELFPLLYETLWEFTVLSPCGRGEEACRRFGQRHKGPVLGEGTTAVVLESPAQARARGAPILAEVRSLCWGGIPTPPGRYPALRRVPLQILPQALHEAGVGPED